MWQEEVGCLEMLLAYYDENVRLSGAEQSYRDFVFDVLCCHQRSLRGARENEEEPATLSENFGVTIVKEDKERAPEATEKDHFDYEAELQTPGRGEERCEPLSPVDVCGGAEEVKEEGEMTFDPRETSPSLHSAQKSGSGVLWKVAHLPQRELVSRLDLEMISRHENALAAPQCSGLLEPPVPSEAPAPPCPLPAIAPPRPFRSGLGLKSPWKYPCDFCGKAFKTASSKKIHERIHTKEKPYTCSFCPMTFAQSSNKQKHERTHTKEKLYICSFCPKAFGRSDHKLLHERSHEKKRSGNRYYASAFLNAASTAPQGLQQSQLPHHQQQLQLQTGASALTGKTFPCSFCPKTFSHLVSKTSHEQNHKGKIWTVHSPANG